MALPTASDNPFPSLLVTEGSAPSSPAAGKQRLFLDSSDHLFKLKNSSGTVTIPGFSNPMTTSGDIIYGASSGAPTRLAKGSDGDVLTLASGLPSWAAGGGGGGAPSTATYITVSADGTLSAEVPRPELDDQSLSGGTPITFTSPTSDDASLTLASESGMAQRITCTEQTTRRHAYVSSAIGTGDFDLRMRIAAHGVTIPNASASQPIFGLFAADSSLTASTRLLVQEGQLNGGVTTGAAAYALGVIGTAGSGNPVSGNVKVPIIHRITRSGTTVTFYVSTDEGRIWQKCGSGSSSLSIGRVGLMMLGGSSGTQTAVTLVHWLRSF